MRRLLSLERWERESSEEVGTVLGIYYLEHAKKISSAF
jgi:hypothetical protein